MWKHIKIKEGPQIYLKISSLKINACDKVRPDKIKIKIILNLIFSFKEKSLKIKNVQNKKIKKNIIYTGSKKKFFKLKKFKTKFLK